MQHVVYIILQKYIKSKEASIVSAVIILSLLSFRKTRNVSGKFILFSVIEFYLIFNLNQFVYNVKVKIKVE